MKVCFANFACPDALVDHQKHVENLSKQGVDTILVTDSDNTEFYNKDRVYKFNSSVKFKFIRDFILGCKTLSLCRANDIDTVIFLYKIGASFFALPFIIARLFGFRSAELIYDLRSGSIYSHWIDKLFVFESRFFKKVIIVSDELKNKLYPRRKDVFTVGLGAPESNATTETLSYPLRERLEIPDDKLIYVYCGTFTGRDLDIFISQMDISSDVHLVLLGGGDQQVIDNITAHFAKSGLSDHLHYLGVVEHKLATEILRQSDVGINVIPLTEQYRCQPSTKLLDYINQNLVVCTNEHELSINTLKDLGYPYFIYNDKKTVGELNELIGIAKQLNPVLKTWNDISNDLIFALKQ